MCILRNMVQNLGGPFCEAGPSKDFRLARRAMYIKC